MNKPSPINFFVLFTLILLIPHGSSAQRLSRDFNADILINQVGYVPEGSKIFVTKGTRTAKFDVINTATRQVVYSGNMKPDAGDFGEYSTGDFSSVRTEGHYYIKSDTLRSYPFSISKTVYQPAMNMIIGYFSLQRCGASTTGYLSPCHLDDGIRSDNGQHYDATGGWHDACDLRKWVEATLYAMLGMAKTYELDTKAGPDKDKMLDELRWGNEYFFKMQEPDGYVMNHIGGDNNRWTDNTIGPDGGELATTKPNAGKSMGSMRIFGMNDDRVIRTEPVNMLSQYNFITSEAMMTRITKSSDPAYSKKCLDAAIKCFNWCIKSKSQLNISELGTSILAGIEMYKTTKQTTYKDFAIAKASELMKLQATTPEQGVSGYFYASLADKEPYKHIWWGCFELFSMCDLVTLFPNHQDAPAWKKSISAYSKDYLVYMSKKNSFGIVPYGLFTKQDPGGNRKVGDYWYRYFMQPELRWWVGINANLAASGIGLMKAATVLNDPFLKAVAQKQLDWIIGVNPFNSSTIISVGYNQPPLFINGNEFKPATPLLPGAVMNGLGGTGQDEPSIGRGNYNVSEYWTPMVAYTLWLMAEISGKI